MKRSRRLVAIRDVVELNRAVLELGRRLALIDTVVCANLLRIQPDEADALANMADMTLEHIAQAGISVVVLEPGRPANRLPADAPANMLAIERDLQMTFDAVHTAAHRCAMESSALCQTYYRLGAEDATRLSTLTELGRRSTTASCALRIHGVAPIVELINRERGMPEFLTRLDSALLASRLATVPF
ncbi:MAG: hypothetical protein BGP25_05375 [Lysobacterales bacterium 63-13]|nr:MAG: hypothetical protein BGP25_05375 [Xanthomonadales bacterium 63-13]